MIKVAVMTSMNKEYYDHIGSLMLETWAKYWPKEYTLHLYMEGQFEIPNYENVVIESWEDNCQELHTQFVPKASGPAGKFAKKGFSFLAGMKHIDCDILIWLDADALTYKEFPKDKIESILPNKKLVAFFDTLFQIEPDYTPERYLDKTRPLTACESGFVVMDKRHKSFKLMTENYEKEYTREKRLEYLGDWYDTNVLTASVVDLREYVEDLSKLRTTNKTQTPLNRCWIGEYVHHAKGKAKRHKSVDEYRETIGL